MTNLLATTNRLLLGAILLGTFVSPARSEINNSTTMQDNFNDNNIDPFEICTTIAPNTLAAFNSRLKCVWHESRDNGTRMTSGAEACADLPITKKGRFKFTYALPPVGNGRNGYPRYPNNKEAAIAQIFQRGHCGSWAAMVIIQNNQLLLRYRGHCGAPMNVLLDANIERSVPHTVNIIFTASNSYNGSVKVKLNGDVVLNEKGINFGFGTWNSDDEQIGDSMLVGKFGQYAFDSANYSDNEIRTVYFESVLWKKLQ